MESLFRKAWLINLAFLLGAAYFGARTVDALVAAHFAPTPELETNTPAGHARDVADRGSRLNSRDVGRLLGIEWSEPSESLGGVQSSERGGSGAVRSRLRVKLLGTLVATRDDWSMAMIEDAADHSARVYMVGDALLGARVVAIERRRVIVDCDGRREFIDREPGDGLAAEAGLQPSAAGAGVQVRALDGNTFEISRADLTRRLTEFSEVTRARVVPAFKDGVAQGFKVFAIEPGSLYSKIGIENGDVIRRINGFEINSPEKALELYAKLRESNRIEFEFDRNGSSMRHQLNVR